MYKRQIFQTTIDSEAICYVIARERLKCHSVEEAVARTMRVIKGRNKVAVPEGAAGTPPFWSDAVTVTKRGNR